VTLRLAVVAVDVVDAETVTHVVKDPPGARSTGPWAVAAHPFAVAVVRLAVMPVGRDPVIGVTRCRRFFAAVLEVSVTVTRVVADDPRWTKRVVGAAVAESPMVAELTPVAWRFARSTHDACVPPVVAPPTRRAPTTAARSRVRDDMSR
jgi:hypothetical protein